MKKLSNAEKKNLRSEAHKLKPVVLIGQSGLTDAVLSEIDIALNAHSLIKVNIRGADKNERIEQGKKIEAHLGAAAIDQIGGIIVLFRPTNHIER